MLLARHLLTVEWQRSFVRPLPRTAYSLEMAANMARYQCVARFDTCPGCAWKNCPCPQSPSRRGD
jgi:hypothetical protein